MKRPILIITLGYIIGIIYGLYFEKSIAFYSISIVFLFLILLAKKYKNCNRYIKIFASKKIIITIFVSAFISCIITNILEYNYENKYKNVLEIKVIATIKKINKKEENYNQYLIKVKDKKFKNDYLLLNTNQELNYGDIIEVYGEFKEPSTSRNYKGYDYKQYLKSIKVYGTVNAKNIKLIGKNYSNILESLASIIQEHIKITIQNNITNKDNIGLLMGILIGNDELLSEEAKDNFRNSSLSHIMAVSGLHVTFVALGLQKALELLKIPKRISKIFIIIFLTLFIYISGQGTSVKRACIMMSIYLGADILYRKNSTINSISLAVLLILLENPYSITDISFLLSFGGTIGIIYISTIMQRNKKSKVINYIKETINVCVSAQIFILPILIIYFNNISLTFIISNILISPIIGIVIILGFISVIIPFKPLFFILNIFLSIIINISKFVSSLPFSNIKVITPNIGTVVIYYIFVIAIVYIKRIKLKDEKRVTEIKILNNYSKILLIIKNNKKKIISAILILSLILNTYNIIPKSLKIHFIDVGQGDACLIDTAYGKKILIDTGGSTDGTYDVGKNITLPYLLDRKVLKLDYVIISHFDSDHCDGLTEVIKYIKIKNLIISKQSEISYEYTKLINMAKQKNIKILIVKAGDKIQLDKETYINIISPEDNLKFNDLNNNSIVFSLKYRKFSILFTGDIEREAEEYLIKKYKKTNILKADILKVAHHGSKSSSTQEFLKEINPKIALIGVGADNNFGHPNFEVIDRLKNYDVKIYRTDECGEISIIINKYGTIKIKKHI